MTTNKSHESRNKPKRTFMCGVCEGFYGKPWTTDQRKDLFYKMHKMGMTTYLYAPKDDYKHRLYWRHLYTRDEADKLTCIVKAAADNDIDFVYALSPGLDVVYSSEEDLRTIQAKLEQVSKFGCKSFALLFDDIDTDLRPEDEKKFGSLGGAQASLTNAMYERLPCVNTFLFCPTEYCTTRACPDIKSSKYLTTLGADLHPSIDIMWTGNKVVSRRLHVEEMKEVGNVLRRPPVIWDNLHANDYDQTRMYLGPYEGRPPDVRSVLRGVLTNPNCEYNVNYIAFHTLAQWSQNAVTRFFTSDGSIVEDVEMKDGAKSSPDHTNQESPPPGYIPGQALVAAVTDWLLEFYRPKGTHPKILEEFTKLDAVNMDTDDEAEKGSKNGDGNPQGDKEGKTESTDNSNCDSEAMDTDDKQDETSIRKPGPHRKVDEMETLSVRDLLLLCDLFFLPYEYGPRAMMMLSDAHWTLNNLNLIQNCRRGPGGPPVGDQPESSREWFGRAMRYHDNHKDVAILVDKLVNIPNRELLYELYCYISDMRSILSMVNSYIKWNGLGRPDREPFQHGDQEPWVNRGGLQSEFRRLLPFEGQNDIFPRTHMQGGLSPAKVYTIRPYEDTDREAIYEISRLTCDDGFDGSHMFPDQPELTADEALGGLLMISPEYCMVVEDESGVCGYSLATPDVKIYQERWSKEWVPQMREKYPMSSDMSPDSDSLSPSQELISTFHSGLRTLPDKLQEAYPGFVHMAYVSSRLTDRTVPHRCLSVVSRKLKKGGVVGVHTVCSADHINTIAGHINLGFEDITDEGSPDDMVVLAKKL